MFERTKMDERPTTIVRHNRSRCKTYDRGGTMQATRILNDLGQSLWLDNITRARGP